MNNCNRENKDRSVFAYSASLVALTLVHEVTVSFLSVEKIHEDMGEAFFFKLSYFRSHKDITLDKIYAELYMRLKRECSR